MRAGATLVGRFTSRCRAQSNGHPLSSICQTHDLHADMIRVGACADEADLKGVRASGVLRMPVCVFDRNRGRRGDRCLLRCAEVELSRPSLPRTVPFLEPV